jgi:hypothetical protein
LLSGGRFVAELLEDGVPDDPHASSATAAPRKAALVERNCRRPIRRRPS